MLLSTKLELSQKGFRQVQGVDYDENFSLVSMLKSVRIMLAIAAFYEIWQMDKQNCIVVHLGGEDVGVGVVGDR